MTAKATLNLARVLVSKNLDQSSLARLVGCDSRHISRIVRAKVSPNAKLRARICEVLEMPFETLFVIEEQA